MPTPIIPLYELPESIHPAVIVQSEQMRYRSSQLFAIKNKLLNGFVSDFSFSPYFESAIADLIISGLMVEEVFTNIPDEYCPNSSPTIIWRRIPVSKNNKPRLDACEIRKALYEYLFNTVLSTEKSTKDWFLCKKNKEILLKIEQDFLQAIQRESQKKSTNKNLANKLKGFKDFLQTTDFSTQSKYKNQHHINYVSQKNIPYAIAFNILELRNYSFMQRNKEATLKTNQLPTISSQAIRKALKPAQQQKIFLILSVIALIIIGLLLNL